VTSRAASCLLAGGNAVSEAPSRAATGGCGACSWSPAARSRSFAGRGCSCGPQPAAKVGHNGVCHWAHNRVCQPVLPMHPARCMGGTQWHCALNIAPCMRTCEKGTRRREQGMWCALVVGMHMHQVLAPCYWSLGTVLLSCAFTVGRGAAFGSRACTLGMTPFYLLDLRHSACAFSSSSQQSGQHAGQRALAGTASTVHRACANGRGSHLLTSAEHVP
jgi:hypothetical protein